MSTTFAQKRKFKKRRRRRQRENRDSIDTNNTSQIALYYPTKDEEEEHKEAEKYITLADLKMIGNNPNQYMEYSQYHHNYLYHVPNTNHPDHGHNHHAPTLLYHSSNLFVKREDTEATLETLDDFDDYDDDDVDDDDEDDEDEDDDGDDEEDDDEDEDEEDDEYTVKTETTTATYKDIHSRHVSDEFIVPYHENMDTLPAILETIKIKTNGDDKKDKKDKKTMKKKTAITDNNDILMLSTSSIYDNKCKKPKIKLLNTSNMNNMITPVQHNDNNNDGMGIINISSTTYSSHSPHITLHHTPYTNNTFHTMNTINTINTKYSPRTVVRTPSLHLAQSDSNNVYLLQNRLGLDDDDELDPDVYDVLSESICAFFKKVDTKRRGSVSTDIIKICFNLLDINLTDSQYIMFSNELTNFKPNKSITLDMLRCFLLNIQNKSYSQNLNHIRLQIIDGLLAQPTNSTTPITSNKSKKSHQKSNKSHKGALNNKSKSSLHKKSKSSIKTSRKSSMNTTPRHHGKTYSLSTFPSIESQKSSPTLHPRHPPKHHHNHNNIKKVKSTKSHDRNNNNINNNNYNSMLWRPHITDHDENGEYQYDLLLCTLKYSLISSTMDLYHNNLLDINYDKLYVYTANQAQKQALQYLFESFFDFMGNYTEYLSLKKFESGLKNCGITVDRQDIVNIAFQQLSSSSFTIKQKYKPTKHKTNTNQLFVTKTSFIAWIIGTIYNYKNTNYQNYVKHYHQYYKWIEDDLFDLINKKKYKNNNKKNKDNNKPSTLSFNKPLKIPQVHSVRHLKYDKNNNNNNNNTANGRHKSHQYYNPVITPQKFHSYNNKKLSPVPPLHKNNKKGKRSPNRHNKNSSDKLFG